jgi:Nif-specific regulatory protein
MSLLKSYNWPGNVRELQNAVERAVALGTSDRIGPEDLPERLFEEASTNLRFYRYHDAVAEAKRKMILDAVEQSKGNLTEAAKILDLNSNYLHRLIHNLNLRGRLRKSEG